MQTQHTAAIHELLRTPTPFSLNLGSTAQDVILTRDRVAGVVDTTALIAADVEALSGQLTTEAQRVIDELNTGIADAVGELLAVISSLPVPAPGLPDVSLEAAPLLSLLTQVQTLALDATPGHPYKGKEPEFKGWIGENVAIHGLREAARKEAVVLSQAPPQLQERFFHAFAEFTANDLTSRGRRFAEVHALTAEVAAFLA